MKWVLGLAVGAVLVAASPAIGDDGDAPAANADPRPFFRRPGKLLDPMEQHHAVPATRVGQRYGLIGHASYSLNELDHDRTKAKHWADEQARLGKIKPDRRGRSEAERAEYLRTKHYPKDWTRHERHKLYVREVADLERLRDEREKRMEVAVRERANKRIEKMWPKLNANLKAAWDADDREKAEKAQAAAAAN